VQDNPGAAVITMRAPAQLFLRLGARSADIAEEIQLAESAIEGSHRQVVDQLNFTTEPGCRTDVGARRS
jgi:hypothetical protein